MKKLFTLIFIFTLSYSSYAQQNFTFINVPATSSTTPFKYASSTSLSAGPSGNQTWDFSGISFSSYPGIPNETYTSGNGLGNLGVSNLGLYYYSISSTGKTLVGTDDDTYTDGAQVLTLPMTYNATTTDAFSGHGYFSVGPDAGSTTISNGAVTTVYDGYGTLITNYGTYTDVVRIKTTMTYTTTYNSTSATDDQTNVTYDWYSLSTGKLIYTLQEYTTTSSGGSGSSKLALSFNTATTTSILSVVKPETSFSVYPNPTTDKLIVQANKIESGNYTVKIINEKGSIEQTSFVTVTDTNIEIETSSLINGKYIINLSSSTFNESFSFIKN
ncbi:MAG TPA: T9SS type A sorting domain-containing protein [Cytophagaceae bacterium]|nr:T9SS type A sorting domain-containing protein [Cytophagaceae bacterium]